MRISNALCCYRHPVSFVLLTTRALRRRGFCGDVLEPMCLPYDPELHQRLLGSSLKHFEQTKKPRRSKLLTQLPGIVPLLDVLDPTVIIHPPIDFCEATATSLLRRPHHRPQRRHELRTAIRLGKHPDQ
jgi:hypothetical protein